MVFYFFKVTLSYFDDEKTEFFITPDQSETDEDGIPFSETDLQITPEFKEFAKKTKADLIDVDYTEYAIEYDPKKSEILNKPVTLESFAEFEKSGQLKVVDENQLLLCLKMKKKKKSNGSGSKLHIVCLIIAAVIVLGVLAYGELNRRNAESETSNLSDTSEISEIDSEEMSDSVCGEDEISDTSVSESGDNSSTNSENTHEVTSSSTSEDSDESVENGSDSVSDLETSENSDEISEVDISNTESESASSTSYLESSEESTESDDVSDNSEIVESDDEEWFDFPPAEDISHLQ